MLSPNVCCNTVYNVRGVELTQKSSNEYMKEENMVIQWGVIRHMKECNTDSWCNGDKLWKHDVSERGQAKKKKKKKAM